MANKAGVYDQSSAAPDAWFLNPSVIIIAVCAILVYALSPAEAGGTLLVLLVVGAVCFVVGRLTASTSS
jgi:hypothetical protein